MQHVTLDLYRCRPEPLSNEIFLRQVLEELPDRIGMRKVSSVELRYIQTSNPLDDGYSGFVIIATSHVSMHCWSPYGMVNLDVFSCEPFAIADVVDYACQKFGTHDVEVHALERAQRSPRVSAREQSLAGAGTLQTHPTS